MNLVYHYGCNRGLCVEKSKLTCTVTMVTDEDTRFDWFLQVAQLTDEFFRLGTLCGMALYNQCLMNIPFPLALFKKLLGLKPTLDDLMELSPTVAQYF